MAHLTTTRRRNHIFLLNRRQEENGSRFWLGRHSPPGRPGRDPQGGRGHMEKSHLHTLVDDLGLPMANAQSRSVVPCRG